MAEQQKNSCKLCMLFPLFIGLLLLVGFWWTVGKSEAEKIENDLSFRSNQLLSDSGVGGVIVEMDGRDATLTGTVASEARSQEVKSIVASQPGIRVINNLLVISALKPVAEPEKIVEIESKFEPKPEPAAKIEVAMAPEAEPKNSELHQEEAVEEILQTLNLSGITFLFGSDEITEKGKSILNEVASVLKEHAEFDVLIEGHTDSAGNDELNLVLSKNRALSVMDYLINHGIESDRLSSTGFGETVPIASNNTVEGRALNRRIEFAVTRRP